MDFSTQLDDLKQHAADAKMAAAAAAYESREQLSQRIERANSDLRDTANGAKAEADRAATGASTKWERLRADASSKMDDIDAKMNQRADELDAKGAASDASWAEDDATAAINYAAWAVDNARVTVLNAISARLAADELAVKAAHGRGSTS